MGKGIRWGQLTAVLAGSAILLSACGSNDKNGSPSPSAFAASPSSSASAAPSASPSASAENVTITYGLWDQVQQPAMEAIIAKFRETHPNIEVKIELTPWSEYWTKLDTAATGGTLPDVFWMNGSSIVKFAANGKLLAYDDYATADAFDWNVYPKSLVDMYSYKGKRYGMPKDYDTIGLWYNKALFDAKKLPYPDDTWDWNKAVEVAKQLTDPAKGIWGLPAQFQGQIGFYNTILEAGGYLLSPDGAKSGYGTPEGIRGIELQTDLILKHKVSPTLAQMTDTNPKDLFKSGKVAMLMDGSWNVKDFATTEYTKANADVAVLPKDKVRSGIIHGLGNVAAANTKHPKEAWEFLKFLGSKDAAEIQAKDGTALPAVSGGEELWLKSVPAFHLQAFVDMAKVSVQYPATLHSDKWDGLEKETLKSAYTGESSAADAAKLLGEKIDETLK
ncbi:ABC transporter substrate-binding protein [Cohnella nanjingensis]|uniref:Sugar ABC transporter substrate-binding protein n=1 Tax=Cohnella nanjingensis TaxID=1387779 RepID=A0A7X0VHE1_9BACL|nr:sugar ABC transporter substrate-binding protein [Cohnella nanjingensis]MBB6674050.1 sugar ABC transporter substrate-binding protein [Cohnella nanjingensis]